MIDAALRYIPVTVRVNVALVICAILGAVFAYAAGRVHAPVTVQRTVHDTPAQAVRHMSAAQIAGALGRPAQTQVSGGYTQRAYRVSGGYVIVATR